MGILEQKLFIDSQKYISVFKAIELIAKSTKDDLKTVIKYLSRVEIETYLDSYIKTQSDAYYPSENYFSGAYQITSEIMGTLFNLKNLKNEDELNSFNYPELYKYEDYYWLKDEFFTCPIIQELNIVEDNLSIESINNNIPLFYLNDTFSLIEASCLLSGDDPIQMNRCFNDTNFDQHYPTFNEAYNFLNSAIWAGTLSDNITSQELKKYLQSKSKIICGFNDAIIEIDNFSDFDESYLEYRSDQYTPDYQFWDNIEKYRYEEETINQNFVLLTKNIAQLALELDSTTKELEKLNKLYKKVEYQNKLKDKELKELKDKLQKENGDTFTLTLDLQNANQHIEQLQEKINQLSNEQLNLINEEKLFSELKGLEKRNQLAQDRQGMARIIALSLWEKDKTIRISSMADTVYRIMIDYCKEDLPLLTDTVKGWIRPVATEEAQKKGRPKSNG